MTHRQRQLKARIDKRRNRVGFIVHVYAEGWEGTIFNGTIALGSASRDAVAKFITGKSKGHLRAKHSDGHTMWVSVKGLRAFLDKNYVD